VRWKARIHDQLPSGGYLTTVGNAGREFRPQVTSGRAIIKHVRIWRGWRQCRGAVIPDPELRAGRIGLLWYPLPRRGVRVVDGAALEKRCAKAPRVRIPPSPPTVPRWTPNARCRVQSSLTHFGVRALRSSCGAFALDAHRGTRSRGITRLLRRLRLGRLPRCYGPCGCLGRLATADHSALAAMARLPHHSPGRVGRLAFLSPGEVA
jgi:hypothetical protein